MDKEELLKIVTQIYAELKGIDMEDMTVAERSIKELCEEVIKSD